MQQEPIVFKIAEEKLVSLAKEISKLNKRAEKIGCDPISFEVLSMELVPDPHVVAARTSRAGRALEQWEVELLPKVNQAEVQLNGTGPKVEGYRFLGTLDHNTVPGSVIVNTVPGETVPSQFYKVNPVCDHCEKIRRRSETFVLLNEDDGSYIQVGRSCLKDFFGHDLDQLVRFLTRIRTFVSSLEESDWEYGGSGQYQFHTLDVLSTTVAIIRTYGWLSRSAAMQRGDDSSPTSNDVLYALLPPRGSQALDNWREAMRLIKWDKEKDLAEAQAAIAWLKEQKADNEYMHNLKVLEDAEYIPYKMVGYWCSLIAAYQRAMDSLERMKRENRVSEHVGTVGERIEATVKCESVQYIDSAYGTVCIHRMIDDNGRTLIWFANSDAKMERGCKYVIRGRVKKHDEYKNWKQTQLTRVSVIREIEQETA